MICLRGANYRVRQFIRYDLEAGSDPPASGFSQDTAVPRLNLLHALGLVTGHRAGYQYRSPKMILESSKITHLTNFNQFLCRLVVLALE